VLRHLALKGLPCPITRFLRPRFAMATKPAFPCRILDRLHIQSNWHHKFLDAWGPFDFGCAQLALCRTSESISALILIALLAGLPLDMHLAPVRTHFQELLSSGPAARPATMPGTGALGACGKDTISNTGEIATSRRSTFRFQSTRGLPDRVRERYNLRAPCHSRVGTHGSLVSRLRTQHHRPFIPSV